MSSWLPSLPYPPPDQKGFWEPVTSTINWCEEVLILYLLTVSILCHLGLLRHSLCR